VPADARQAEQAVEALYDLKRPAYLRLSRYPTPDFVPAECDFRIGRAQVLREGNDICLCGCGPVLVNVLAAAEILGGEGFRVGVVNFHTLKPFDLEAVAALIGKYRRFVSIEEHSIIGGLGSALAEVLAERGMRTRLLRLGVADTFGESGSADELLAKHGLDAMGIASATRRLLKDQNGPGH
jgi:transketolase